MCVCGEERTDTTRDRIVKVRECVCVGRREQILPGIRIAKVRERVCVWGGEKGYYQG